MQIMPYDVRQRRDYETTVAVGPRNRYGCDSNFVQL
jgi:hypothetical protein